MITKANSTNHKSNGTISVKDFSSDQTVRWCPGCGDYSILKQVQSTLVDVGVPRENIVFISGIGCSSRFPYYMNTYGMHSIHGRATAIASGLKAARPDTDVWVVTGDGDSLAIGGNHLIHLLRRNLNLNVLLFNNEIYGLTKGQYSPTSPKGKISKTSPMGTIENPFDPASLALGADGSFIARALDRNPKHLKNILRTAHDHKGTSFIEIYQNCVVFNPENFSQYSNKGEKEEQTLYLEHGKPLLFGENNDKAIILNGFRPEVVQFNPDEGIPENVWIHDKHDKIKAAIIAQAFGPKHKEELPRSFGVLYEEDRSTYEDDLEKQIQEAKVNRPNQTLEDLLNGSNTWDIHSN